ncbi:MAG TPA: N-acetylmannosamine-6-phosphate 2-epimerase [Candidatus Avimonas sp.]|nr:N-acetylmannosamine-6-phosphate 2-epimerase [Clostridiales bacterium]HPU59267.1 N-acetylmannosamine-6-phosphate 2-epimerase [Candidatus Avimonas sp.]
MGRFTKSELLAQIKGNLIVSCQATKNEPFFGPENVTRFALAALNGGAKGIRANTVPDVAAIMAAVGVPVLALIKRDYDNSPCYITPTMREVDELVEINADVVAVDATLRIHPDGQTGAEFIAEIRRRYPDLIIMADIATFEEGVQAAEAGADLVSTTLSGYTDDSPKIEGPDFELIEKLAKTISVPVIGEGRIWTIEDYREAFNRGAYCVVIGSAITRPHEITKRFVQSREIK